MSKAERKGFWLGVLAGLFSWTSLGSVVGFLMAQMTFEEATRREAQWSIEARAEKLKFIAVGEQCARKDTVDRCLRHCAEGFDDINSTNWCTAGVMGEAYK